LIQQDKAFEGTILFQLPQKCLAEAVLSCPESTVDSGEGASTSVTLSSPEKLPINLLACQPFIRKEKRQRPLWWSLKSGEVIGSRLSLVASRVNTVRRPIVSVASLNHLLYQKMLSEVWAQISTRLSLELF
jgi:hypothetical protein